MRIATGFALLEGSAAVLKSAPSLSVPLRIVHGSHDRATDHRRSVEFVQAIVAATAEHERKPDVQCKIYEGYEHVMLKVGVDDADDAKRQAVLADMENWLSEKL
jgi:acylglycerol lipase